MSSVRKDNAGFWAAFWSYLMWGVLPIYWGWLHHIPAYEVIAQRTVWSAVSLLLLLLYRREIGTALTLWRSPRTFLVTLFTATLIGINWGIYVWAIHHGYVLQTSLGYFIAPLMNVLSGIIFFHEPVS